MLAVDFTIDELTLLGHVIGLAMGWQVAVVLTVFPLHGAYKLVTAFSGGSPGGKASS